MLKKKPEQTIINANLISMFFLQKISLIILKKLYVKKKKFIINISKKTNFKFNLKKDNNKKVLKINIILINIAL
jgi:hypothetical protein